MTFWVAGAAIVGAGISANSASKGRRSQERGARAANATQQAQFEQSRMDQKPWMDRGNAAGDRLNQLLGLQTAPQVTAANVARNGLVKDQNNFNSDAYLAANPDVAAQLGSKGVESAWAHYTNYGMNEGRAYTPTVQADPAGTGAGGMWRGDMGGTRNAGPGIGGDMMSDARYRGGDVTGNKLTPSGEPENGSLLRRFSAADLQNDPLLQGDAMRDFSAADLENDVVYQSGLQFGLSEGAKGINRLASAGGGLNSGEVIKALARFGSDYQSTKAGDAYNRFNANRDARYAKGADSFNRRITENDGIYNKLAGIAGTGQTATNQVGALGANVANNVSQNQIGVGNARGSAYIAQGNALTNGISQGVNAWQRYQANQQQNPWWNSPDGVNANGGGF